MMTDQDSPPKTVRRVKSVVGVVRLLRDRIGASAILAAINRLPGGTAVELLLEHTEIILTGAPEDVENAYTFIQSTYLTNICYENLEINESDLRLQVTAAGDPLVNLIEPLEKTFECVIEVRSKGWKSLKAIVMNSSGAEQKGDECSKVLAIEGDLTKFHADVLVNTVIFETKDLSKAGPLSKIFLKAGGPELNEVYSKVETPVKFGEDVAVTPASGSLKAKQIYHAVIKKFESEASAEFLYDLIRKCLEMAKVAGLKTIAFPPLGCGNLGYHADDVANCFARAARLVGGLQVYVVAVDSAVYEAFKMHTSNTVCSIVFHINTLSNDILKKVREELKCRTMNHPVTAAIEHSVAKHLSPAAVKDLNQLKSTEILIDVDAANGRVNVKAPSQLIDATRAAVLQILDADKRRQTDPAHIKKTKGVVEYLKLLGSDTDPVTAPSYWTRQDSGAARMVLPSGVSKFNSGLRVTIAANSTTHKEIETLVARSWDRSLVGQGTDAVGLKHGSITVKTVWRIENPRLYARYIAKRKELCHSASLQLFPSVNGLDGEAEVATRLFGVKDLERDTVPEVNEYILLHGTKKENVDVIMNQGLDSRVTVNALYGLGSYFTESTVKADQYADSKTSRVPAGQPLFMYVVRVLLGHPYVGRQPHKFCRPPCKQPACTGLDRCKVHTAIYDSVIGTHRDNNAGRLLFREFISYHPDQCYPEYLVEYVRV